MWSSKMLLLFVGLLAMADQSMQLSLKNPLRIPDRGSVFGLIATSITAEKALFDSGLFIPSQSQSVHLFGREFISGKIHGLDVVYVRSESTPAVHVGITVQILCDHFEIEGGIIHYGAAGSTTDTLSIGDVVIPAHFYFTGAWEWLIDGAKVVYGGNASSSDIYVSNPTYRNFLFNKYGVRTADTTGAAFVLAALSNSKFNIVFQGISNEAGGSGDSNNTLACENAFSAAAQFLKYLARYMSISYSL
ncbi:bark storage protein A-like [Euphorbia lathyris]|uniref:bark storage protein A-like n=1 Tax=Euphorbia lathyris TaxID=212925 RepID=UPI003313AE0B